MQTHRMLAIALLRIEHEFYLTGMRQGRADAQAGLKSRLKVLWTADTALRRGYVHAFDGWQKAIRNTRRKETRG